MTPASADDVAELLGERADEIIVERIVNVGASLDEVSEALDDLDHQMRFDEERDPASPRIAELRAILEELPALDEGAGDEEAADEGLRIVDADELAREA